MSLPDPSVLAESLGLVAGSGPFVEPIWAEVDYTVTVNVIQKAEDVSPPEWDSFFAAFNALYLPSLVFVMNNLPLDSKEALTVTRALFTILRRCMVFKTSQVSPTFARFVRLETAKVLQLYTSLFRLIASASKVKGLESSHAILPRPYELLFVVTALVIAINTSFTSAITPPAIEPSVKKDLVVVVKQLEKAHLSASEPSKRYYRAMYEIFDAIILHGSLDLRTILPNSTEATMASPWWNCELKRAGDEEIESCAQLEEGEEMMACSRCFAVRYCSREHQRLDWKRHKQVCFKPSW